MFRVMAGEGCDSSCSDAYPLPFPFYFSLFPFRPSNLGPFRAPLQTAAPRKNKVIALVKNTPYFDGDTHIYDGHRKDASENDDLKKGVFALMTKYIKIRLSFDGDTH